MASAARNASLALATLPSETKHAILHAMANALRTHRAAIEEANAKDIATAKDNNLATPLLKRLGFSGAKIDEAVDGLLALSELPEGVGRILAKRELSPGLILEQVTCPLGVIGVIFESRPDALIQISALCLKSGNAVLLKGGSEAKHTNRILTEILHDASVTAGAPVGWMQLLETRADVAEMLSLDDLIDLIIPRGSNEFVRHIMENSRIPVMGHADGICHLYVDDAADIDMAVNLTIDSKTQYVAVCNALETLLVHEKIAPAFLERLGRATVSRLAAQQTVARLGEDAFALPSGASPHTAIELRGCPRTCAILPDCTPATDADWDTEYLDYILSIKIVDSLDEAIDHINRHGSGHTDAIVTTDTATAETFLNRVDSANVFWNASTRFADGFRYGLGAEVGISTSKIHARGPVGLEGLLIYKWKLRGSGDTVAPFASGERRFTHRPL